MNYNDLTKVHCECCIFYDTKTKRCGKGNIRYLYIHLDGVQCSAFLGWETINDMLKLAEPNEEREERHEERVHK